jgi:hypothetical protein
MAVTVVPVVAVVEVVVLAKALLALSVQAVLVAVEPSFFTTRIMENNK